MGFAAESENIEAEARKKLVNKNLDLIAVNDINARESGFAVDSNKVTLIGADSTMQLPHTSKEETATLIFKAIADMLKNKSH